MRLLQETPTILTRGIASRVGISNGAAYYCVTALVDKGCVKLENFIYSKKNTNYFYQLISRSIRVKAILTVQFLERKRDEYHDFIAEIDRLEVDLGLKNEEVVYDR